MTRWLQGRVASLLKICSPPWWCNEPTYPWDLGCLRDTSNHPTWFFGATVPCIHPPDPLHFDKIPSVKLTNRTWKWMVGRLLSFWEGLFSVDMWVSRSVSACAENCLSLRCRERFFWLKGLRLKEVERLLKILRRIRCCIYQELQTTSFKWMLGWTTIPQEKIWNSSNWNNNS